MAKYLQKSVKGGSGGGGILIKIGGVVEKKWKNNKQGAGGGRHLLGTRHYVLLIGFGSFKVVFRVVLRLWQCRKKWVVNSI